MVRVYCTAPRKSAELSLLVGGTGIVNIMLAAVLERTREIGVRRAIGARQVGIRNQFVMEAFAVTVIRLSVGVSAAVGLVYGSYPAMRAARLSYLP